MTKGLKVCVHVCVWGAILVTTSFFSSPECYSSVVNVMNLEKHTEFDQTKPNWGLNEHVMWNHSERGNKEERERTRRGGVGGWKDQNKTNLEIMCSRAQPSAFSMRPEVSSPKHLLYLSACLCASAKETHWSRRRHWAAISWSRSGSQSHAWSPSGP